MKSDMKPIGALRLTPCNYGLSRVSYRGPMRPTDGRFVAILGGSETFAKYVDQPFPDLVETTIGEVCVNLGCHSAGPDVFLRDTAIQALCHDAAATVIQVLGAINQSNPYYRVHPRRNDRFIAPTDVLRSLYPEIDFSEISFTGHLIARLRLVDEERFALVRTQLQKTWVQRMTALISMATGPVVLLWLVPDGARNAEPAFVTREMVQKIQPLVAEVVEVQATAGNIQGLNFAPLDELSVRETLGADVHIATAQALRAPLMRCLA